MKYLSDKLLMIALAIVLGVSPLQTIAASVSKCMSGSESMHHQMNVSNNTMQHNMGMIQSENQHECCQQNTCDMSHCASTIAAVLTSDNLNDMAYTISNVHLKPTVSLISFYSSSLYRPPKV